METEEIVKKLNTKFMEHLQNCELVKYTVYSKDITTAEDIIELEFKNINKKDFAIETNERDVFEVFLNKFTNKLYQSIICNETHKITDKASMIEILNSKKPYTIYDTMLINRKLYNQLLIKNKIQNGGFYLNNKQVIFDTWGLNIIPVTSNYPLQLSENAILFDSPKILLTLYGKDDFEFDIVDHEDTINIKSYFRVDIWETFMYDYSKKINSVIKVDIES